MEIFLPWLWVQFTFLQAWIYGHLVFYGTAHFTDDLSLKDGAYYCYCAYVLRISRYLDFLSPMLTNTGIFLHGLKLSGESRS